MKRLLITLCFLFTALPAFSDVVVSSVAVDDANKTLVIRGSGFLSGKPQRDVTQVFLGDSGAPLLVTKLTANEVIAAWQLDFDPGTYPLTIGFGSGARDTDQVWIALGAAGPEGPPGPKGDTGATGSKGDKGDPGAKGDPGVKGDPGAKGDTGDTGPQGPQGIQGPSGASITSLDTLSGLDCTLASGAAGKVKVTVGNGGAVSLQCALAPGYRIMFVTSGLYIGTGIGGLAGADAICQSAALSSNLPNGLVYRAWLSTTTNNAIDRFAPDSRPVVTVTGVKIANSLADLSNGLLANPPNLDQSGALVTNAPWAWTGTLRGGRYYSDTSCHDWSTTPLLAVGLAGDVNASNAQWTESFPISCATTSFHLYCIAQ